MTAQEFINTYNGRSVPGDGAYIGQCVDLAQLYAKQVCGWANPFTGNAKDWATRYDRNLFTWIANTPTGVPQLGDLVVWNMSPYGHIGIALGGGNVNTFKSLDNNWPWGLENNYHPAAIISHNYNNVAGWLRPKGGLTMGQFEDLSKVINDNFVALKNQYTQFDADRKNDIAALNTKEDKNFQALWNWCDALQKTVIKMAESEALQAPQIEKAIADADKALKAAQASPSLSTEQLSSVSWITKQLEKIRNFFK